jgi:hypothetical protein
MGFTKSLPDWHEEDVVCFAAVPTGQVVDWTPGSYEPQDSLWPPEGTFLRLRLLATQLKLPFFSVLDHNVQTRWSRDECRQLLAHWSEMAAAVEGTPGASWVAAIGLLLKRCAESTNAELLIEGS